MLKLNYLKRVQIILFKEFRLYIKQKISDVLDQLIGLKKAHVFNISTARKVQKSIFAPSHIRKINEVQWSHIEVISLFSHTLEKGNWIGIEYESYYVESGDS